MATEVSAAQRALHLPELLSIIFMFLHISPDRFDDLYAETVPVSISWGGDVDTLRNCALVNKRWNDEAVRYLWKNFSHDDISLEYYLFPIVPSRRQFYAQHIEAANWHNCGYYDHHASWMSELMFARLTILFKYYSDGCSDYDYSPPPHINAPRLEDVETKKAKILALTKQVEIPIQVKDTKVPEMVQDTAKAQGSREGL
ncbi:hypothetical protein P170DRAFT_477272 [Aspergillus steynii IBT 23096]|uniref:F-box domain-containing protein n=1 Tax=Aspergillus steynii IBT 23096 TaxID=1392250 RepID=A0A2I2G0I5_9EURO|nr:uncharacterized protein P170DRAFT_477272 [Aspergillus steynii IBT 23096]PLB46392.1 hypothetical protein P170DRAFT_477272 [Aspergillus steynii IBT 23096]